MKTVKAKDKQTIMDVALEQYGTLEAVGEILANNPGLINDAHSLAALGIDAASTSDFYPDVMLEAGQSIEIDDSSELIRSNVLRQINSDITTFDL